MRGKTSTQRLQVLIWKILRISLRFRRRMGNEILHPEAEEPLLRRRLRDSADTFFEKTAAKNNHLAALAADGPTV
jgi:hypothetical protein